MLFVSVVFVLSDDSIQKVSHFYIYTLVANYELMNPMSTSNNLTVSHLSFVSIFFLFESFCWTIDPLELLNISIIKCHSSEMNRCNIKITITMD